jgi:hypothetical protein
MAKGFYQSLQIGDNNSAARVINPGNFAIEAVLLIRQRRLQFHPDTEFSSIAHSISPTVFYYSG